VRITAPSPAQQRARRELKVIAAAGGTPLQQVRDRPFSEEGLRARLRVATAAITVADGGMPLASPHEEVSVVVPPYYPWAPPSVHVEHDRFLGYPHVLGGSALCLYLDPAQEWHPDHGVIGFLNRLWQWLNDAAAGTFDARRALFHPVGGLPHHSRGTPTLVVRCPVATSGPGLSHMAVRQRSDHRLDLITSAEASTGDDRVLVVALSGPLSYGAGNTIRELLAAIDIVGTVGLAAVIHALRGTARRNPGGTPLHVILAVPDRPVQGDADRHLVCARLPATAVQALRGAAPTQRPRGATGAPGLELDEPLQWCRVSEERTSVTTRRVSTRPVSRLRGKRVVLWGCGGLGSWVGDFIARAGVSRMTLADPGVITGGLLVRQNYLEADIGTEKATALAARLRAVSDDLVVEVTGPFADLEQGSLPECDVLIDCTVSHGVAAACSSTWSTTATAPLLARMATDRATSTLGLLTTRPGGGRPGPEAVDRATGAAVAADPTLEAYSTFWTEPLTSDELLAEPGCSVPTFHGSAADLAAVAAVMTNLLAPHLDAPDTAGSHLMALPGAGGVAPSHRWLPCQ
jgi:hypothetical protein